MESKPTLFDYTVLASLQSGLIRLQPLPIIAALLGIPILFVVVLGIAPELYPFLVGATVIFGFVTITKIILDHQKRIRKNAETLAAFAAANNMQFKTSDSKAARPGSLFSHGHSRVRKSILSGKIESFPFETFAYEYVTGAGKSRQVHNAMVMEITLPRILPQFVIDSELENVLPIRFDKDQKIELEGDFHKYFDLYAPDTYGVSALTLLAPDVMETLMERAALCDIEVVENKCYFYWQVQAQTKEQYEQLFETVSNVLQKMGETLATKNIFATQQQSRLHTEPSSQGVRLKKAKGGYVIGLIAVGYFVVEGLQLTEYAWFAGLMITSFWVGLIGYVIYTVRKQTKLKQSYMQRYSAYTKKNSNL